MPDLTARSGDLARQFRIAQNLAIGQHPALEQRRLTTAGPRVRRQRAVVWVGTRMLAIASWRRPEARLLPVAVRAVAWRPRVPPGFRGIAGAVTALRQVIPGRPVAGVMAAWQFAASPGRVSTADARAWRHRTREPPVGAGHLAAQALGGRTTTLVPARLGPVAWAGVAASAIAARSGRPAIPGFGPRQRTRRVALGSVTLGPVTLGPVTLRAVTLGPVTLGPVTLRPVVVRSRPPGRQVTAWRDPAFLVVLWPGGTGPWPVTAGRIPGRVRAARGPRPVITGMGRRTRRTGRRRLARLSVCPRPTCLCRPPGCRRRTLVTGTGPISGLGAVVTKRRVRPRSALTVAGRPSLARRRGGPRRRGRTITSPVVIS